MREREESARFMASIRGNAIWPRGLSRGEGVFHQGIWENLAEEALGLPRKLAFPYRGDTDLGQRAQ